MKRLETIFTSIRQRGRAGLITFSTAGDPDIDTSAKILQTLDKVGVDVLEVGVPFSDPLADGPVIQRASERALKSGANLTNTLEMIRDVRDNIRAGIVLFTYSNPVVRMGLERFATTAASAGVDGVLILDLPIEESREFHDVAISADIAPIFLLSPTTSEARIDRAAELGRGFLYGISRLGVTGVQAEVASNVDALVRRIRGVTDMPLALGFGVSKPEHVAEIGQIADAVVVGSGLVDVIARSDPKELLLNVENYIMWLLNINHGDFAQAEQSENNES